MQSHGKGITLLPPELLTEIFRLATDNPARDINSLVYWTPFEGSYAEDEREACKGALRMKCALSLVCRLFRSLVAEYLYEDIWIRYGTVGLLEALEVSKDADSSGLGYGRFVKRVTLSPVGSGDMARSNPLTILSPQHIRAIIACCPYVRVIRRPPAQENASQDQLAFLDGAINFEDLEFPYLERVEWHNVPSDAISAREPTPSLFLFSHSIRVLILGPDNFPSLRTTGTAGIPTVNSDSEEPLEQETVISLPNLHTLGIQSLDAFGEPPRRYSLHLPSLRHLLLKQPEAIFTLFDGALSAPSSSSSSPSAAQTITSLELALDFRFLRQEFISTLLSYCSRVADLYIPVFSTRAAHQNTVPRVLLEFTSLKRVHLSAKLPRGYVYGQEAWWTMLNAHFDGFCGEGARFVALEKVVLSGWEWKECVRDERFEYALHRVRERGVELVADDSDIQCILDAAMEQAEGVDSRSLIAEHDQAAPSSTTS